MKYGLAALGTVATLILLVVLFLFWLLYTGSGARFAINLAAEAAGFDLAVKQVEGRLIDTLQLKGVRLAQPRLQIRVESVVLRWQLLRLLNRRLKIEELILVGVQVQDDRPPTAEPPKLHIPTLPDTLRGFSIQADLLKLKDLTYRHLQTETARINEFTSRLTLDDGLLTLSDILLVSPQGRLSGDLAAGLLTHSLKLDLTALPARPVRGMDFLSLEARLLPAQKPQEMAGPVEFVGKRRGSPLVRFTGALGVGENLLDLHNFEMVKPQGGGSLTGDASMVFADPEPLYTLDVRAKELDLTRELKTPTNLTGTLNFSGSLSRFTGSFDLTNKGEGWREMSLASDYRGDAGGVKLLNLRGKALDGTVAGTLNFAWSEGTKVSGDLSGRGLNPELLAEGWPGRVNLNLKGNLQFPEEGPASGALVANILESRLRGRMLQGEVAAAFVGEKVRVDRLLLTGKGFKVTGSGALNRKLSLSARISDLSELAPEATGALYADGWLRWRDGVLSAAFEGTGHDLQAAGVSAGTVRFDARLGEGEGYPVYLDAALGDVRAGKFHVQRALVSLQGTAEDHRASASFTTANASAQLAVAGGYSDGTWKGTLTRFSGHDGVGPWSLAEPAPLLLSGERIRISPLLLTGAKGERLQIAADLDPGSSTGTLSADWNALNLARANAWLSGMELEGATSGEVDLRLLSGNRIALDGTASARAAEVVLDGRRVELDSLAASFTGGRSGLHAEVVASLEGGSASLTFDSGEPASLELPERGDLALEWSGLDLAAANPWLTGAELEGRTSGDVNLHLYPGRRMSISGNAYAEGALETDSARVVFDRVAASVTGDRSGYQLQLDAALAEGKGNARLRFDSPDPLAVAFPRRGDLVLQWSCLDLALLEPAFTSGLVLKGKSEGLVTGKLSPGKRVDLTGNAGLQQGYLDWQGRGDEFEASIDTARADFKWRGDLDAPAQGELELKAAADAYGRYTSGGERVASGRMALRADTGRAGTVAEAQLCLEEGGGVKATFSSDAPATAGIPERGDLVLQWSNLDLALLEPAIDADLVLQGKSEGSAAGKLSPGRKLDVTGHAKLEQGHVKWQGEGDELDAAIDTARADFKWRGDLDAPAQGELELKAAAEAFGRYTSGGERVASGRMTLRADTGRAGTFAEAQLCLEEGGGLKATLSSDTPATAGMPERADLALQWSNLDLALLQPAIDADLVLQGKSEGRAAGRLAPGKKLDVTGNAKLEQGHVNWQGEGDELDASIDTARADFTWRGDLDAPAKGELELKAAAEAIGRYTSGGERIASGRLTLRADTGRAGTAAEIQLALEEGGGLKGTVTSDAPATAGIPARAAIGVEWGGIDAALLKPWLPGELNLRGKLSGRANGQLMPGQRLEMAGEAQFAQGRAEWQGEGGEANADVRSAKLDWNWRGDTLTGTLNLALAEYGNASGEFQLPIPARLPVTPDPNGAVRGQFSGKVVERGFVTTFLPGLVQETKGELDVDLRLAGTWSQPSVTGALNLANAGAYIPSAGITVTDLQLSARLADDRLLVARFSARSDKGEIHGNLEARLEGWQLAQYSGSLKGTNFQTLYLPEVQMVTSPSLTFSGGGDTVVLRGEVLIPQMLISGPPANQMVKPSEDVILVGARPAPEEKKSPLKLDGKVKVVLGDKVEVKASGIEARLTGQMDLVLEGLESITSSGEIRVAKGKYSAYGLDLEIVRGRIYYVNDPVDQPTLDVLAVRTIGDVKAGVTVVGGINDPIVKLYSDPAMPEVDILAYMMLGHPLGTGSTEQGALLATAATSLFSLGDSSSVQEQIKDRLGLDVLGLTTADTSGTGTMGYKAVKVAPTGAAPAETTTAESLFTVGKYLTPELYVSYGRSLVTGANLFLLRYDITKRLQVETQSGTESGADIYYKWEFK